MNNFQAITLRPGVLRIEDLPAHVRAGPLTVLALDASGIPIIVELRFAQKWGNGWSAAFECPLCASPARVLAITDELVACGRCKRRPTLQSRCKNQREWAAGQLADELARALLNERPGKERQMRITARKLRRLALAKTDASLALAVGAIGAANRALREKHG